MRKYIGYLLLTIIIALLSIWVWNLKHHPNFDESNRSVREAILNEMNAPSNVYSHSLYDTLMYGKWIELAKGANDTMLVMLLENLKMIQTNHSSSNQGMILQNNDKNKITVSQQDNNSSFEKTFSNEKDSLEQVATWLAMKNELAESELEKFKKTSDSLLQILASKERQTGILFFNSPQGAKIQYVGEIKNGKASGFGMGIWQTGHKYEGLWSEGLKEGLGIYRFANGEVYHGEFSSNKRAGKGVYFFKNGDRYAGWWDEDIRVGVGAVFSKSDKIKKAGIWSNDRLTQNKRLDSDEEQQVRTMLREFKGR